MDTSTPGPEGSEEHTVVASAPGKVILFGEHAVVYGKTAVAAAVSDLRIVVTAVRQGRPFFFLLFLSQEGGGQGNFTNPSPPRGW